MSVSSVARPASTNAKRRGWLLVGSLLVAGSLLWVGWTWWSARRYRAAMAQIDTAMAAGKFGLAARDVEQLLAWKTDSDEAAYVLGMCEQSRGRSQAADAAWSRVAPGSAFTQRAILARLRLYHDTARLAAAEKMIVDAANDPRNDGTDLLVLLVPIYSLIGRSDDAERLIEDRWEHLYKTGEATPEQSIKLVRVHMDLTWKAPSLEALREYLDQVGRAAPDDDRVWLGRADLATRTGAHDEAKKWLDACERQRPEDAAVWRARLRWGIAANRIDAIQDAQKHLPAGESTLAQRHRLSAWLCAHRGDVEGERQALESLAAADPTDMAALDRLAQLGEKAGQPARVVELKGKEAEIERVRTRYRELYERTQHVRDAEEMSHLAEQLGRTFEARVFLTLAISQEPERADLRRDLERLIQSHAAVAPGSNRWARS